MKKRMKTLLGILLAALLSLTACGTAKDEVVLKIDDREIMRSEYMVYLYTTTQSFVAMAGQDVWNMDFDGQTADELVEERTISTLQSVIAAKEYAAANDISLTEEEKAATKTAAEQFISSVSEEDLLKMGVDAEKLQPLMEDSYLYTLVYQQIAAECEVDAADMAGYYRENKDKLQVDYTSFEMQSILLTDAEKAAEAAARAEKGEDFEALFREYDVDPAGSDGGKLTVRQSELQMTFSLAEEVEAGDVIGPMQMGEGWFVLKAVSKEVPAEAEVKELAESLYTNEVQTAYAEARFGDMMKGQKVEKISGVWDTLEKFH